MSTTHTDPAASNAALERLGQTMMAELEPVHAHAHSHEAATTSSSDSEPEDKFAEGPYDPANYMLNGLRNGMNTVHKMARTTLADCETEEAKERTAGDMKLYTLELLRREKLLTESFGICTQIIDDIMKQDEEDAAAGSGDGGDDHNWDKKPLAPYVPTVEGLTRDRERMNKMYDDRMKALEDTLTDDKLKSHPRFESLEKQIDLGAKEFKENLKSQTALTERLKAAEGDDDATMAILIDSCKNRFHIDYGEEVHAPGPSAEYVDPITKRRICNPARNMQCKHVFEKQSIQDYIEKNPGTAKCPVRGCENENILKMEHFL